MLSSDNYRDRWELIVDGIDHSFDMWPVLRELCSNSKRVGRYFNSIKNGHGGKAAIPHGWCVGHINVVQSLTKRVQTSDLMSMLK